MQILYAWLGVRSWSVLLLRFTGVQLFGSARLRQVSEIRRPLLAERREGFAGFRGAQPLGELSALDFRGLSELLGPGSLDQPLGSDQRAGRFCRKLLRRRSGG